MISTFRKLTFGLGVVVGAHLIAADSPVVPIVPPADSEAPPGFYSVTETESQIELKTPYGTLHVPTGFGSNVPYRLSIPVDQLKKNAGPLGEKPELADKPGEPTKVGDLGLLLPTGKAVAGEKDTPRVIIDDADSLVVDANRLFNRRRYYEALTVVDQLLRKRPEYTRGWLMKGSLLLVQGHKDLAMKAWRKAQELEPANPEIQSVLSRYQ